MKRMYAIQIFALFVAVMVTSSCTNRRDGTKNMQPANANISTMTAKKETAEKLKYTSGIRSILHDSKGRYWFGSHQEGASFYDGKSFTYFTVEDGLSDNQVRTIQEDENGVIWFGTADGVSSYNGIQIQNHSAEDKLFGIRQLDTKNNKVVENALWFNAGNNASAYCFDGGDIAVLPFPVNDNHTAMGNFAVTDIANGKDGMVWFATYSAVFGYDGDKFTTIDDKSLGHSPMTGYLHVRSILEDSKGRLWIGNNGIGVLLMEGGSTVNFSDQQKLIHFNSSRSGGRSPSGTLEHVFAIGEDRIGNIWFGDRDTGAWKYDGKSMTNYTVDSKLATQHIWDIYEDRNGELLFAMDGGGVYAFNGTTFDCVF